MCFDCSAFQYQLDQVCRVTLYPAGSHDLFSDSLPQDKPLEDHVFQTIFLNKKHEHTWTRDEIKKDKISECLSWRSRPARLFEKMIDRYVFNSSRRLVAPALSFLDPLRFCRPFRLASQLEFQAYHLCWGMDFSERSRVGYHIRSGTSSSGGYIA